MKTKLPTAISTIPEAKALLLELHKNGESFHPEDDATDLSGDLLTREEGELLNKLMEDIYNLEGNNGNHATPIFDPCEFYIDLINEEIADDLVPEIFAKWKKSPSWDIEEWVKVQDLHPAVSAKLIRRLRAAKKAAGLATITLETEDQKILEALDPIVRIADAYEGSINKSRISSEFIVSDNAHKAALLHKIRGLNLPEFVIGAGSGHIWISYVAGHPTGQGERVAIISDNN